MCCATRCRCGRESASPAVPHKTCFLLRQEAGLKRLTGKQSRSILFYASASPRNDSVGQGLLIARPFEKGRRQTALNVLETKRRVNSGNLKFCISRSMPGPNHRQRGEHLKTETALEIQRTTRDRSES